jgi:hypothetical protein
MLRRCYWSVTWSKAGDRIPTILGLPEKKLPFQRKTNIQEREIRMKQLKLFELVVQLEIEERQRDDLINLMAAAMLAFCQTESEATGEPVEEPKDTR